MCDDCRARDRAARKIKALRESGVIVDALPGRTRSPKPMDEKKKKKRKKKRPDDDGDLDPADEDRL